MPDVVLLVSVGWLIVIYVILPGVGIAGLIMDALPRSLNLNLRIGLAIATACIFVGFVISSIFAHPS